MQDSSDALSNAESPGAVPAAKPPQGVAHFFLDGERRLRTAFRLLLFGVLLAILELAAGVLVVLGVLVYLVTEQVPLDQLGQAGQQFIAKNTLAIQFFLAPPSVIHALAMVIVFRLWLDRRTLASCGFVPLTIRRAAGVLFGLFVGTAVIGAIAGIAWVFDIYQWAPPHPISWVWWSLLPTLILMAFFEEIIFRAYLLQNFRDIGWPVFGVLFSSLIFWLVHAGNPAAWSTIWIGVNLFGAGVALSLAYMASGDIWLPTAVHFAWNYAQGPLLGIPVSGMQPESLVRLAPTEAAPIAWSGGAFGLEGSVLCLLANTILCALFGALLWLKHRRPAATANSTPAA